jgi:hypothetical protein
MDVWIKSEQEEYRKKNGKRKQVKREKESYRSNMKDMNEETNEGKRMEEI